MILLPDADTAMMDPFTEHSTISFICNVLDAITREPYTRDPRYITQKAEKYLKSTGLADISYWGPEIEFFIFDSMRFDQNHHEGYYHIDSVEGFWNSGNRQRPQSRQQDQIQRRLLPRPPHGPVPGSTIRDGVKSREMRRQDRSPSPRSRHRRPD